MRWPVLFILGIAGALAPAADAAERGTSAVAELARQEARLAAIGWRLATASAGWCPATAPQPGWILSDARRFDVGERAAARSLYGVGGDGPFIAAIAPGSSAANAGLVRGARIAAINGQPVPELGDEPTTRIDTIFVMLAALDPAASLTVTDGAGGTHRLAAAPGCASGFRIERKGPPAAANGKLVRLTLDLAQSIADDDELAAVIAHELAHNILRHPARLAKDASARRIRQTEIAADRLAVWLLADAGYDPAAAVRFWKRHKKPLIRDASHPPRRERIAAIEAEIAAMRAARAAAPAAVPPLE